MIATDLSSDLWDSILDFINRSRSPREIFFQKVVRNDTTDNLIWTKEYGDTPIPLFTFDFKIYYYDTVAGGGPPFNSNSVHRREAETMVIVPKVGDLAAILDMWAGQRYPICVGSLHSTGKFWADEKGETIGP